MNPTLRMHPGSTPPGGLTNITPRIITMSAKPPFKADHVGSFLRPKALLDARQQHESGQISAEALRAVEDEAIRGIVKFQEDLGLKGITDGEFRRTFFHTDFLTQLDGVVAEGGIQVKFHSKEGDLDFAPPDHEGQEQNPSLQADPARGFRVPEVRDNGYA